MFRSWFTNELPDENFQRRCFVLRMMCRRSACLFYDMYKLTNGPIITVNVEVVNTGFSVALHVSADGR